MRYNHPVIARPLPASSLVRDYVALTKPRIILLLLVTALGGMFLAAGGAPEPITLAVVLVAGSLAAGGANAINQSLDRDIDNVMRRTRGRPVAGGRGRGAG